MRSLERRYRRSGTDADRLAWIKQLKVMHILYEEKDRQYWRRKIAESSGNMEKLWQTLAGVHTHTHPFNGPFPGLPR